MKTPGKNQKKQDSSDSHGSKANAHKTKITTGKDAGKGPWKDPDPTGPKKSPEKVNEPYAGSKSTFPGNATSKKTSFDAKGEKVMNAGESEHHIPVNKSDYEKFEDEYEDFEFEEEEDEFEDEDEDGETSDNFYEDEEDESKQFRSKVVPAAQKKANEQAKFNQKQPNNKTFENKFKSQLNENFQKRNKNPQG